MKALMQSSSLHIVIDANRVRPVLEGFVASRWPEARLRSVHVPRVMPKKSGEIVIQYELGYHAQDESIFVPHILFAQYSPDGLDRPVHSPNRAVWNEDFRLLLWPFPIDPELDHLGLLCNSEEFHQTYDAELENVGFSHVIMGTPAEVLGYRLGRRCVARVRWRDRLGRRPAPFPKNDIVIKMGRRRQTLALWTRWRQLEHEGFSHNSSDGIGMPKSLFLHSDTGALFQEYNREVSVHDQIGCDDFAFHCGKAALALSKLHGSRVPGLANYSAADELGHLQWLTTITAQTFPAVAISVANKLRRLIETVATDDPGEYTTAHRDFYDKQVLSGESKTVLLDCDTLAMSDPALDYGNFIAHLHLRAHQHEEHAASILDGAAQFKESYREHSKAFRSRASWWIRASLLRLACIYIWRPRWHNLGVVLSEIDHDVLSEV